MPASSPASRPTFSGVWTHTPTRSRSGGRRSLGWRSHRRRRWTRRRLAGNDHGASLLGVRLSCGLGRRHRRPVRGRARRRRRQPAAQRQQRQDRAGPDEVDGLVDRDDAVELSARSSSTVVAVLMLATDVSPWRYDAAVIASCSRWRPSSSHARSTSSATNIAVAAVRVRDLDEARLVAGLPARLLVRLGEAGRRGLRDQAESEASGSTSGGEAPAADEELRSAAGRCRRDPRRPRPSDDLVAAGGQAASPAARRPWRRDRGARARSARTPRVGARRRARRTTRPAADDVEDGDVLGEADRLVERQHERRQQDRQVLGTSCDRRREDQRRRQVAVVGARGARTGPQPRHRGSPPTPPSRWRPRTGPRSARPMSEPACRSEA